MKYVISDIHGCYREYMALLHQLCLSENDHLYILGDAARFFSVRFSPFFPRK